MGVSRVVPNISSENPEETAEFFTGLLGFEIVMDMHSVITVASPQNAKAQINILRIDVPSPAPEPDRGMAEHAALRPPQISIEVDDVDKIYALAQEQKHDIRYPITDEDWGVRRFFVAEPNGLVVNVLTHI